MEQTFKGEWKSYIGQSAMHIDEKYTFICFCTKLVKTINFISENIKK